LSGEFISVFKSERLERASDWREGGRSQKKLAGAATTPPTNSPHVFAVSEEMLEALAYGTFASTLLSIECPRRACLIL
jgi:hypothetical protein